MARSDAGAAAVELALILPVLVLILWGILEFGQGYSAKVQLTGAVRDGARTAALSTNAATVLSDTTTAVRTAAPGLTPSSIVVALAAPCPVTPSATDKATVTATYPFRYDIPFFRKGTWKLTAKAAMRCGG